MFSLVMPFVSPFSDSKGTHWPGLEAILARSYTLQGTLGVKADNAGREIILISPIPTSEVGAEQLEHLLGVEAEDELLHPNLLGPGGGDGAH